MMNQQCPQCGGIGKAETIISTVGERVKMAIDCPSCDGTGEVYVPPDSPVREIDTLERIASALERIAAVLENGLPIEDIHR